MKRKIIFRVHALKRMFERNIGRENVIEVIEKGEIIEAYPNDQPFPSFLKMELISQQALHVVYAESSDDNSIIVITTYWADPEKWDESFKRRKK